MLTDKTILITGGVGFIGSHLAQQLAQNNTVIVYDNYTRDAMQYIEAHKNITIVKGDVLDSEAVKETMQKYKPTHVLHLAAIAGVQTVVSQPAKVLKVNLIGTHNVLNAVNELQLPIERFVDFSTSEVYGPSVFEADEEGMTTLGPISQPRWYYAASKLSSEYLTHAYHREFNLPTVTIRPFNVYGPLQIGEGAVHNFVQKALAGDDLIVHNEGGQIRSWCFVDDFVDGVIRALEKPEAIGHSFNIGNPQATVTNLHLAKEVIKASSSKSTIQFKAIDYPEINLRVPSIDKAKKLLGYEPQVDVEEGVAKTVAWMQSINK